MRDRSLVIHVGPLSSKGGMSGVMKLLIDNPPKKLWKRNKKISNIDILSYFQKKNIDNNIKELYNSSNKEKKIYSNNKRSVMYIK